LWVLPVPVYTLPFRGTGFTGTGCGVGQSYVPVPVPVLHPIPPRSHLEMMMVLMGMLDWMGVAAVDVSLECLCQRHCRWIWILKRREGWRWT
jgi:hypothetical protein